MSYRIERWKRSRFWAVYRADLLVTVCAYRTGARALVATLIAGEPRHQGGVVKRLFPPARYYVWSLRPDYDEAKRHE
jgi:hypothetical protein